MKSTFQVLKQAAIDFIDDKVLRMSAALAYYTVFSLPAMLLVIIWVSDIFLGREAIEGSLFNQISDFVGAEAAKQIEGAIRASRESQSGGIAAVIGIGTLLITATTVFGEIQDSINYIWRLKAKPKRGFLKMLLNRLISFSMLVGLGFLLLVTLMVHSLLSLLLDRITALLPDLSSYLVYIINLSISFLVTSLLFGIIFKVLPDAKVKWRHVRAGAFTTAILFMVGEFLIGLYLGSNQAGSIYGAAGSLILILLWVYYSSMILYFGAEFTRVYAMHKGERIYPNEYAVWIQQVEIESEKALQDQPE